jgi:hypothetical protein
MVGVVILTIILTGRNGAAGSEVEADLLQSHLDLKHGMAHE